MVCDLSNVILGQNHINMTNKFETLKYHQEDSDNEDDIGPIINDLGPVQYPPGEHRLQHVYCLWFSKRPSQVQGSQNYGQNLRLIGQVGTVEQWWGLYSHLVRLHDIPAHRDLHLFKKGIKPMWEDPANKKGGKWVIRLKKEQGARAWENLCMAMLGEQFVAYVPSQNLSVKPIEVDPEEPTAGTSIEIKEHLLVDVGTKENYLVKV